MDFNRFSTFHHFLKGITGTDIPLYESAMGLYFNIMEGLSTNQALDKLRDTVGENNLETDKDGVFDLSDEAGFVGEKTNDEILDNAIDQGIENGSLDDFGTALSTESAPTEGDFGLDGLSEGGDDFGLDLDGSADDMSLDDGGDDMSLDDIPMDDASLDDIPMDDTVTDDSTEGGDIGVADDTDLTAFESVQSIAKSDKPSDQILAWAHSWLGIMGSTIRAAKDRETSDTMSPNEIDAMAASFDKELDSIISSNPVMEQRGITCADDYYSLQLDPSNSKVTDLYAKSLETIDLMHRDASLSPYTMLTANEDNTVSEANEGALVNYISTIHQHIGKFIAQLGEMTIAMMW